MTLFAYLNGSDVGNKIRLNAIGLTSRGDGSPGVGGIEFDDSAATLSIQGWHTVVVKETACTAAPVLFVGYVADRTYGRVGQQATYSVGASRFINANILDLNALLHVRLITGEDGKRGAETDDARITALLASSYVSPLVTDTTYFDTSAPHPLEDADFRGQYPDDELADITGQIRRIWFLYPVQPTGAKGFFYDLATATTSTSTLTISNVLGDLSATCFSPSVDATLTRDPSEVYSKVRITYRNGTIIGNRASTATTYFTDNGLLTRGIQVDSTRIGVEATARSRAEELLTQYATETDSITVRVQLPAASVGLIDAGQRIGVRFSHLPGYETQQFVRVQSRIIEQAPGTEALYNVTLELSNRARVGTAGGGGVPGPGTFPAPPPGTAAHFDNGVYTFMSDNAGTAGGPGAPSPLVNTTIASNNTTLTSFASGVTYTFSMKAVGALMASPNFGVWDVVGGAWLYQVGPTLVGPDYIATTSFMQSSGATIYGYATSTVAAFGHVPQLITVTFDIDPVGWDHGGGAVAPIPGQPVPWTVVTMTTVGGVSTGTTLYPYADRSLLVKVDGVLISTASYTETSGAAGTFALTWIKDTDEVVTVSYQGR